MDVIDAAIIVEEGHEDQEIFVAACQMLYDTDIWKCLQGGIQRTILGMLETEQIS